MPIQSLSALLMDEKAEAFFAQKQEYPDKLLKAKSAHVFKRIYNIPHHNNGMIVIIIVGKPNSGKSYAGIFAADVLAKNFIVDHIVFSASGFMERLRGVKKKGEIIFLDDASLVLMKRDAMTKDVKELAKVLHSYRFKNCITILTLPSLKSLEGVALAVADILIEMKRVDKKTKTSFGLIKYVQSNPVTGNVYFRFPTVKTVRKLSNGLSLPIRVKKRHIFFELPDAKLLEAYEKRKQEGLDAFYLKTHKRFKKEAEHKQKDAGLDFNSQLQRAIGLKDTLKKGKSYELVKIMAIVNVSSPRAKELKHALELIDEGELVV